MIHFTIIVIDITCILDSNSNQEELVRGCREMKEVQQNSLCDLNDQRDGEKQRSHCAPLRVSQTSYRYPEAHYCFYTNCM